MKGRKEALCCRLLRKAVRAGALVDFQNAQGNSALHFACHRGDLEARHGSLCHLTPARWLTACCS